MNFSLRDFINRIAWQRVIIFFTIALAIYYYSTNKFFFQVFHKKALMFCHNITNPFSEIGAVFNDTHSEVFGLCVLAMVSISIICVIKLLLKQRQ